MTASPTPLSVGVPGNQRVAWIPGTSSNPLSSAILGGGTTKDITFSLIGSGLTPSINENSISDSRFGATQVFNKPGNHTEELALEYIFGDTNDIAQPALTQGTSGFIVARVNLPNATAWAASQTVHVWTVLLGFQQVQPPAENALLTIKQSAYITAPTQYFATTAA